MKHIRFISILLILASFIMLTSCCFDSMQVFTDILSSDDSETDLSETGEETSQVSAPVTDIESKSDFESEIESESESESASETESESATETTAESQSESESEAEPQYRSTTLPFVAHCDYIGEDTVGKSIHSKSTGKCVLKGYSTDRSSLLRVSGWCIIEGGVSKYVWSMDGGKTWQDIDGNRNYGTSAMLEAAENTLNYTFESDFTVVNAHFQGCGTLVIDLYDYSGKTLNIIIGAVPLEDEGSVATLFYISNLQCN